MLISMVPGIGLGLAAPDFSLHLEVVSTIFPRLIKSIIAPILFGLLVPAFANSSSGKAMALA